MLAGLSDLTSDSRHEVSKCALEVLFDLLNERGSHFSLTFWENIFHRVLFPIFDHVRHVGETTTSRDGWIRETTVHALQLLCNLFNTFYKVPCLLLSMYASRFILSFFSVSIYIREGQRQTTRI